MSIVLIGSPADSRVVRFQECLADLSLPPARLVSYVDLLSGEQHLADVARAGDIVRVESPGKSFEANRALLLAGAQQAQTATTGARHRVPSPLTAHPSQR